MTPQSLNSDSESGLRMINLTVGLGSPVGVPTEDIPPGVEAPGELTKEPNFFFLGVRLTNTAAGGARLLVFPLLSLEDMMLVRRFA